MDAQTQAASAAPSYVEVDHDPFAGPSLAQVLPTTEAQREVWLAAQLSDEANLAYNESVSLRLIGSLDADAMTAALQALVQRHALLRATVSPDGLSMCVAAESVLPVPRHDLRDADEGRRAERVAAHLVREVETPFDLVAGPLLRASLLRLGDAEHQLVLTAHHIVCDGWSTGIMTEDLAALYTAARHGRSAALEPAVSFADYVGAETGRPEAELEADDRYWLGRFESGVPVLDLPSDRPRPARRGFASRRLDTRIDAALVVDLKKLGGRLGVSLFGVLFAGFACTLARIAQQPDVVIGVPTAGQSATGLENLVGHCVNLLPVRVQVDPQASAAAEVGRLQALLLDAMEHQRYTFGTLLKKLPLQRDPSRLPLVSVMLNVDQSVPATSLGFDGLHVWTGTNARHFENFELFVNLTQVDGAMQVECQYNTGLFDRETIAHWMQSFEAVLRAIVADPQRPVGQLNALGPAALDLLRRHNDTAQPLAADAVLPPHLFAAGELRPDAAAIRDGAGALAHGELRRRCRAFARALRRRGIGRGQLVGLSVRRGLDMVVAQLGILESGAGYVPLDPDFPLDRLAFMAEDAGIALLVTESALAGRIAWPRDATLFVDADAAELAAAGDAVLEPDPMRDPRPDSAAYVIYTSGSTGKPKGVVVPHRAVVNFLQTMAREPGLSAADRLLAVTTLSFDIAVLELLLPIAVGGQVLLASREQAMDGAQLGALIERWGATVMQATPSTWRLLLDAGWSGAPGFRALVGGEALPADLARELLRRCDQLWNMYGPTETTVWSTCCRITDDAPVISIGTPIANTSVWVLDAAGQPSPIGATGEIYIGGDGVTLGYHARPELTAERFVPDPFAGRAGARLYRTGDRGRLRHDGRLEHLGRLDFQVKVRGYRIELGEIEACVAQHGQVARVVVVAREDEPGDVRLVAYVVPRDAMPSAGDLREHLRRSLPDYMLPQHVVELDEIPLLPNGKIDRKALPRPEAPPRASEDAPEPPRGPTEEAVARSMAAALKLPQLGRHDDFFSLGGHSLLAARVIAQLNRQFELNLSLRVLFEAPSVEKLAAAVDRHRRGETEHARRERIVHRPDQSSAPLTLMQERVRFIEEMRPGRLLYNAPSAHRLSGPMDLAAFNRAFEDLVHRQPSLRTSIAETAHGHVQRVDPDHRPTLLPPEDLSALPREAREARLRQRLDELVLETFDLARGPLYKARLFRLAVDEHALFFSAHHLVWDGWSFDLLYADLGALYEAHRQGRTPDLPPLEVTYGDFADWHERFLRSPEIATQVAYWKAHFAQAAVPREPLGDVPRLEAASGSGETAWLRIERPQADRLHALARRTGSTLSIVALSAYAAIMSQWLGTDCPSIGVPVRGRPAEELEGVMGFFNNTLPVRFRVEPHLGTLDWIRAVRQVMVGAFAHQDVPFELLAREFQVHRSGPSACIYQTLYTFQDARQRVTQWGPLKHARIPVLHKGATEDMSLWLVETEEAIVGGVQYSVDLYQPAMAAALRDRFLRLLDRMAGAPEASLRSLMALADDERAPVDSWGAASAELDAVAASRPDWLAALARHGARMAWRHGEREIDFDGLVSAFRDRATIDDEVLQTLVDEVSGAIDGGVVSGELALALPLLRAKAVPLPGDAVLIDAEAPQGHRRLLAALAWSAGASVHWLPAQADAATWALALRSMPTALVVARVSVWQGLLEGAGSAALPPATVWLDVRDTEPELLARLFAAGCTVLSTLSLEGRLATCAWLVRPQDSGLASDAPGAVALRLVDRQGDPVPAGYPGSLQRRDGSGWVATGVIARWRPDGRLQYVGDADAALDQPRVGPAVHRVVPLADALAEPVADTSPGHPATPAARDDRVPPASAAARPTVAPPRESTIARAIDKVVAATPATIEAAASPGPVGASTVSVDAAAPIVVDPDAPRDGAEHRPGPSVAADLSATERVIAEEWAALLGTSDIRPQDNFFELGGSSLLAVQAALQVERRLGRRVSARRYVFETLAQLARAYDAARAASGSPDIAAPRTGDAAGPDLGTGVAVEVAASPAVESGGVRGLLRRWVGSR